MKSYKAVILIVSFCFLSGLSQGQGTYRNRIEGILAVLMKDSQQLHLGGRVGYSLKPEKNKYVSNYRKLKRIATDEELVQMTSDARKAVVLYAFSALHERNHENLKQVFINHVADSSQIWTTGGCTGVLWQVNQFMLHYLNPQYAKSKMYMSKEEYDRFANQINWKL